MNAASRIYVREWPNGAFSVHYEPTEGAMTFDCHACLEATGGLCAEHQDEREPECDEDGWPMGGRLPPPLPPYEPQ